MKKYSLIWKGLVILVIFLFLGTSVIPTTAQDTKKPYLPSSKGNWLYVGGSGLGNYTKIQDAINDSSDGDTVFVYDDSSPYYENIMIDKEIRVIGEEKNTTIIDGGKLYKVVRIFANNSSIEQFTIQNSATWLEAIFIDSFHDVLVKDNIIVGSPIGIKCDGSFCEFSYNYIDNINGIGIETDFTSNFLYIHHNNIQHVSWGIRLKSNNCIISYNVINDTFTGIDISESIGRNEVSDNIIMNNYKGVYLQNTYFNYFYRNSFIANDESASFHNQLFRIPSYNKWVGNYWDDIGAFHIKRISGWTLLFGIYPINMSNFDWRPAREPYNIQ